MTNTTREITSEDLSYKLRILQATHMTATVQTRNGSSYTIIARPYLGVVVTNDTQGWVTRGDHLEIRAGHLCLINKDGRTILGSTGIVSVNILTN